MNRSKTNVIELVKIYKNMVSILLATYNGEKYIKKSIESVLSQTFSNFELLVGFNGTSDNSKSIVENFSDDRIKIFDYESDKGKSITLNKLINETNFDLICIQDDDDIWLEEKLEKQIRYCKDFDIVGTHIYYINEMDSITGYPNLETNNEDIVRLSLAGINQIANTSAIFKKKDAIDLGGWNNNLDGIEDYDFWLRLMRKNKTFFNLPEKLVLHRVHNNSNFNTKKYDLNKIL